MLKTIKAAIRRQMKALARDDSGAAALEYGLLAALIAVVIISGVQLVGVNLSTVFSEIATKL